MALGVRGLRNHPDLEVTKEIPSGSRGTFHREAMEHLLAGPYPSSHYPDALFDDVDDVLAAANDGLVTTATPGVVVNCPIVSENATDAPRNTPLSEDFPPFDNTF